MIPEVYDALLGAGASEKARRAAETLASNDNEFHRIDQHLSALDACLEQRFSAIDGRFNAVDVRFAQLDGRMRLLQIRIWAGRYPSSASAKRCRRWQGTA